MRGEGIAPSVTEHCSRALHVRREIACSTAVVVCVCVSWVLLMVCWDSKWDFYYNTVTTTTPTINTATKDRALLLIPLPRLLSKQLLILYVLLNAPRYYYY